MSGYLPVVRSPPVQVLVQPIQFHNHKINRLSLSVADGIYMESIHPINVSGRFCDLFVGYHYAHGKVALKRLRVTMSGHNDADIRRFRREADTWQSLNHPHILKFLGTFSRHGHLYMVSPFIDNGTLSEYLINHPLADRRKLLFETARALLYLHESGIIHADIKAQNILVSAHGFALLCDFGLTRLVSSQTSTAMKGAGSVRWQSPELWNNEPKSFKSDIWAFGMTIYEVLSGKVPFYDLQTDTAVLLAVIQRDERPPRAPMRCALGMSYEVFWTAAESCWRKKPLDRTDMRNIVLLLGSWNFLPSTHTNGSYSSASPLVPSASSVPAVAPPQVGFSSPPIIAPVPRRIIDLRQGSVPLPTPRPSPAFDESKYHQRSSKKRSSEDTPRTKKKRRINSWKEDTPSAGPSSARHDGRTPDSPSKDAQEDIDAVTTLEPMSNIAKIFQFAYGGGTSSPSDSEDSDNEF